MRALGLLVVATIVAACTPIAEHPPDGGPRWSMPVPAAGPPAEPPVPPEPPPPPSPRALSRPEARQTLVTEGGHVVEVYPPLHSLTTAAPLVVFLHATCMEPADVCDFWSAAGREESWLLCPAGPSTCNGAPDWSGTPQAKADALGAALATFEGAYGAWVDHDQGDVLIGYSRGAFAARDILYHGGPGRFRGLILLSAAVSPDPARLKAAGIRRAVLATGDLDGSRPTMRHAVQTLETAGIPTKFMSLGKIGHWLPENLETILREAIAWVEKPAA